MSTRTEPFQYGEVYASGHMEGGGRGELGECGKKVIFPLA